MDLYLCFSKVPSYREYGQTYLSFPLLRIILDLQRTFPASPEILVTIKVTVKSLRNDSKSRFVHPYIQKSTHCLPSTHKSYKNLELSVRSS